MNSKRNVLSGAELHKYRGCIDREVPGRGGMKEYAPDGSWLQGKHLEKFRETYREVLTEERVQIQKSLLHAEWNPEEKFVELKKSVGNTAHSKGYSMDGKTILYPEEALFLMDEGRLEVYYGGLPLSIQEAFGLFLHGDLTIDQYHVYAHLSRAGLGYVVRRHILDSDFTMYERKIRLDQHLKKKKEKSHNESTPEENVDCGDSESQDLESLDLKRTKDCEQDRDCEHTSNKKAKYSEDSELADHQERLKPNQDQPMNISERVEKQSKSDLVVSSHDKYKVKSGKLIIGKHTNWNFDEIQFPNVAGVKDSYTLESANAKYLPMNLSLSVESYTLCAETVSLNKSVRSKKFHEEEQLEFSFPDSIFTKSKARNWTEYKQELCSVRSVTDDLHKGPVGHLWCGEVQPLIEPQAATSTGAILDKLKIIENMSTPKPCQKKLDRKLRIMFDVYLPNKNFKKSNPGLPNHRIIVMNMSDPPPDLATINHFSSQCKDGVPLHWAVVDNGDIAFYTFDTVDLPRDINMG